MRLFVVAGIALAGAPSFAASESSAPAVIVVPASLALPLPARATETIGPVLAAALSEGVGAPLACSTSLSAITPCTQTATSFTNRVKTTLFTIQNKFIEPVSYILSCTRTSAVTTCSAPGTLYVPKNSSKSVLLTWTTTSTLGSGSASLTADEGTTPVTGPVNATVTLRRRRRSTSPW